MTPIVVIPCGAKKKRGRYEAQYLYVGSFFRAHLVAALRLTDHDRVLILSGKYGFVRLHTMIDSYDMRLGQPGAVTSPVLREQARSWGLINEPAVIALGGAAYRAMTRSVWPHATEPTATAHSFGDHMHLLTMLGRE